MIVTSRLEDTMHIYDIVAGSNRENLLVYLTASTTKEVALALADAYETATAIGVILADNSTKVSCELLETAGEINCILENGITASTGDTVFLSASEAGKVTNIPPSIDGQVVLKVGIVDEIKTNYIVVTTSLGQPVIL